MNPSVWEGAAVGSLWRLGQPRLFTSETLCVCPWGQHSDSSSFRTSSDFAKHSNTVSFIRADESNPCKSFRKRVKKMYAVLLSLSLSLPLSLPPSLSLSLSLYLYLFPPPSLLLRTTWGVPCLEALMQSWPASHFLVIKEREVPCSTRSLLRRGVGPSVFLEKQLPALHHSSKHWPHFILEVCADAFDARA